MTHEPTRARAVAMDEPGLHHDLHDHDDYSARGSLGERLFLWIAWALGAAFIAFTMGLYFPGFLNS